MSPRESKLNRDVFLNELFAENKTDKIKMCRMLYWLKMYTKRKQVSVKNQKIMYDQLFWHFKFSGLNLS